MTIQKFNATDAQLEEFRKYHFRRGLIIGVVSTSIITGMSFVIFCHALLAVIE